MKRLLIGLMFLGLSLSAQDQDPRDRFIQAVRDALAALDTPTEPEPSPVVAVPCGESAQAGYDTAPAGGTVALEAGCTFGPIIVRPKPGASADRRVTITTQGWQEAGPGWEGLEMLRARRTWLARLQAPSGGNVVVDVPNADDGAGGYARLVGLELLPNRPAGAGTLIRIGSGSETDPTRMARHVEIRQVYMAGDPIFGQKRGIEANGADIDIAQVDCRELFIAGQDSQCVGAWNGGQRVTVRHSYLAAGAENLIIGGAPIASAGMLPSDWLIEDVIVHKPLRWQQDGRNRQVKNLLEFKYGRNLTVRRVLAVNTWRAAQDGTGLLLNATTNGRCPQCGNLENVLAEDLVMLNTNGGISFQGFSYDSRSFSDMQLRNVTVRHAYIAHGTGRAIQIANVRGRHDIRIERSTFVNGGQQWIVAACGYAWADDETRVPGCPMQGLAMLDNVFRRNGKYGITTGSAHYGTGIGTVVDADLELAGNVLGDDTVDGPRIATQLATFNRYIGDGAANISVPQAEIDAALSRTGCSTIAPGKGADCTRLAPVFALRQYLPEP